MSQRNHQNSGLDTSSLDVLDVSLTRTRSSHFSMFVMEFHTRCDFNTWLPGYIAEPTPVSPVKRFKTSDVDDMSLHQLDELLEPFIEFYEFQGTPLVSFSQEKHSLLWDQLL